MWIWIKRHIQDFFYFRIQDFNSSRRVWLSDIYLLYHLRLICVLSCSFAVSITFFPTLFLLCLICYHFIYSFCVFALWSCSCSVLFVFYLHSGHHSEWGLHLHQVEIVSTSLTSLTLWGDIFVYFSGNDVQILMKRFSFQISFYPLVTSTSWWGAQTLNQKYNRKVKLWESQDNLSSLKRKKCLSVCNNSTCFSSRLSSHTVKNNMFYVFPDRRIFLFFQDLLQTASFSSQHSSHDDTYHITTSAKKNLVF